MVDEGALSCRPSEVCTLSGILGDDFDTAGLRVSDVPLDVNTRFAGITEWA